MVSWVSGSRACDDGDSCTVDDVCVSGTCIGTRFRICEDDDPCTINDRCDAGTGEPICTYEAMWPPIDPSLSCDSQGCLITMSVPQIVYVNDDDDDANGVADLQDTEPIVGEDDLVWIPWSSSGCAPPPECEWGQLSYCWDVQAAEGGPFNFYLQADKTGVAWGIPWTGSDDMYIEGYQATTACGVPAHFAVRCASRVSGGCAYYTQPIRIVRVESLMWEKGDLGNADLESDAPINGGVRIFPGKLSTEDPSAATRRNVKLVATIEPPIEGIAVHFKVFDVDDPFDQINPNMPDVGIIDGDADGPDNRGSDQAPGTYSATTDQDGKARVTITVSMQPGNNYRAGASVLHDAINQASQTKADSLGHTFTSGYCVPLIWSPMLTVWRRLHVEVDSMAAPDVTNTQTGIIPTGPTFDPANNHAVISLAALESEFEKPDQHQVGKIDILTYGAFTTVGTDIGGWPYTVEIVNAPPNIVNAAGKSYNLWDDDAGSVPPFVMVGFNVPPVVLPRVPNTSLMPSVFREAYVDVVVMGAQYYDESPFDRNVAGTGEALMADGASRDLTSAADYWVVHVTSAFQGYVDKDNDPDTEEAGAGLQYGITIEQGYWPFPIHSSGALVYVETIRDKARGNAADMTALERYTVAHELGHQFLLQHEDGRYPPGDSQDPGGDYIMTDILGQTGMAPNLALGATCIRKVRNITYPPQP